MANFWKILQKVGLAEEVPDGSTDVKPVENQAVTAPVQAQVVSSPEQLKQQQEVKAKLAAVDNTVREQLANAMQSAGADLVEELGDLLDTLKESLPDERARYVTAIKIIAKKGGTIQAICTDIDKCIGVLEEKDREFNAQLKTQFDKRVGGKTEESAACEQQIATKQQQLAQLEQEISALASKKSQAEAGIFEEREKLEQVQSRYESAHRAIRAEIELQRAKVTQYGAV